MNDEPIEVQAEEAGESPRLASFQKAFLAIVLLVFVASVAARAMSGGPEPTDLEPGPGQGTEAPRLGHGALPQGTGGPAADTPATEAEPGALEKLLPYLSEGSLFALIGFALGYTTRKIVKLLLILIAVGFVGIQLLSSAGLTEVDWGGVVDALNGWILNLKESGSLTRVLTDRIPSTGALMAGLVVGFRRG